jgi:Protein of unknown function (DUF3147)
MEDYVARFLIGGLVVSAFAMLGDVMRPKSFAGLFGAAPSVALATLGLTIFQQGEASAAAQTHSMIWGTVGLFCYSLMVCQLLMRLRWKALTATTAALAIWLVLAVGLQLLFGGLA